ncbi:MAG: PEP-CTERM sorting domain-containing protein [Verrucomicrobiota bacterium]
MKRMLTMIAVLAMVAGVAQAAIIVSYDAANGADPTTQANPYGNLNEWGGGFSNVPWVHGGYPALITQDNNTGGGANYEQNINADKAAMSANGWKFTVSAFSRWARLNDAGIAQMGSNEGAYRVRVGENGTGQVVEILNFVAGAWTLAGTVDSLTDNVLHKTELVYDGNVSGFVDVFVDDVEVLSDLTSFNATSVTFFGSASGADTGEIGWGEVTLETIPEPATTGMLMLGSALVLGLRRLKI